MEPGISGEGITRTDMHCHYCSKGFIAELDFSINGKHVVECPHCAHEHCRVIMDGKITADRWEGRNGTIREIKGRSFWKSDVLAAKTSKAHQFIRDSWLRRTDINLE